MKWSFATIGIIMLGLIGISIILLFQTVTTSNENDYYLLKEVTEAAMIDAIDIPYYRETGELKIVREKFVENFTRRYAESTLFVSGDYKIKYYDIMETPPKVSIIIDTGVGTFSVAGNVNDYNVQNKLDAILEYTGKYTYETSGGSHYGNPYTNKTITEEYYAIASKVNGSSNFNIQYSLKLPSKLIAPNIKNVKISDVKRVNETINQGVIGKALLLNEISYNGVVTDSYMQSINKFATNVSGIKSTFYNCMESGNGSYKCDDVNKYYVTLSGSTSETNKSAVIFKYKVTWSYDEYEFS